MTEIQKHAANIIMRENVEICLKEAINYINKSGDANIDWIFLETFAGHCISNNGSDIQMFYNLRDQLKEYKTNKKPKLIKKKLTEKKKKVAIYMLQNNINLCLKSSERLLINGPEDISDDQVNQLFLGIFSCYIIKNNPADIRMFFDLADQLEEIELNSTM